MFVKSFPDATYLKLSQKVRSIYGTFIYKVRSVYKICKKSYVRA